MRVCFVTLLDLGEVAEQLAHLDVRRHGRCLLVEARGLKLHRLRFLADRVERQVRCQPDRATLEEALHVLAADGRQLRPETRLVYFEQLATVVGLLLRHFIEDLGGAWITVAKIVRECHIDAGVLLLRGNRDRENFARREFGKGFHGTLRNSLESF